MNYKQVFEGLAVEFNILKKIVKTPVEIGKNTSKSKVKIWL